LEPESRLKSFSRPTFLADEMLGRLAKWLRLLGYDTKYVWGIPDSDLLDIAESEDRVILTRDTLLVRRKRCQKYIFVHGDHWRDQLKQVFTAAKLDCESALTICAVCNKPLASVGKSLIKSRVPPYVYETRQRFSMCSGCSRVYWTATHTEEIMGELAELKGGSAT